MDICSCPSPTPTQKVTPDPADASKHCVSIRVSLTFCQGAPRKKIPNTTVAFFSGVTPGGGGGYGKKNSHKIFSGPKKLKFFYFYRIFLNAEGARRIPFKVFIQISADLGGICV